MSWRVCPRHPHLHAQASWEVCAEPRYQADVGPALHSNMRTRGPTVGTQESWLGVLKGPSHPQEVSLGSVQLRSWHSESHVTAPFCPHCIAASHPEPALSSSRWCLLLMLGPEELRLSSALTVDSPLRVSANHGASCRSWGGGCQGAAAVPSPPLLLF